MTRVFTEISQKNKSSAWSETIDVACACINAGRSPCEDFSLSTTVRFEGEDVTARVFEIKLFPCGLHQTNLLFALPFVYGSFKGGAGNHTVLKKAFAWWIPYKIFNIQLS